jgi:ankyrin
MSFLNGLHPKSNSLAPIIPVNFQSQNPMKRFVVVTLAFVVGSGIAFSDDCDDFMTAVEKGDQKKVAAMLKEKPELANLSENISKLPAENHTALQCASMKGHQEIVELLLANHADVNGSGHSGFTPLYQAAENGHLEIVKLLVERGADPNLRVREWDSNWGALQVAVWRGHPEVAEWLLARGVELDFHTAAGLGKIKQVEEFLGSNTLPVNTPDRSQRTALQWAVQGRQVDVVKVLVGSKADFNATERCDPPLILAIKNLHPEMVELLLASGADANVMSRLGTGEAAALHHVLDEEGHAAVRRQLVEIFVKYKAYIEIRDSWGQRPLHYAALNGQTEAVESLLDHKAFVNCREDIYHPGRNEFNINTGGRIGESEPQTQPVPDMYTPLHNAIVRGHVATVKLLLARGADPNAETTEGYTPLHNAAAEGNMEIISLLLARGVDVNARTSSGLTPLFEAASYGKSEAMKLLLDNSADCNVRRKISGYVQEAPEDRDYPGFKIGAAGTTPLMAAAWSGDAASVKVLLDQGMDVNVRAADGKTALMAAVVSGDAQTVKLLLENGADAKVAENEGLTALTMVMMYREKQEADIVELLLAQKANPNCRDLYGMTPLHMAVHFKKQVCVVSLLAHGADANARVSNGPSGLMNGVEEGLIPLHMAVSNGATEMVQVLIARGADVNAKTKEGGTALTLALVKDKNSELVKILRQHGAKE